MPPHAFKKSPLSVSFIEGCAGEWSEEMMVMGPAQYNSQYSKSTCVT
jgi:hypothetical protein